MVKQKRIKQVEDWAYVAFDGSVFWKFKECYGYEEKLLVERLGENYTAGIPSFYLNPPEYDENYCYEWYYVRNETELSALKHYLTPQADSASHEFQYNSFPFFCRGHLRYRRLWPYKTG